ncbi:hypothetical protein NKG05_28450 [Oerskovia sp. M15]
MSRAGARDASSQAPVLLTGTVLRLRSLSPRRRPCAGTAVPRPRGSRCPAPVPPGRPHPCSRTLAEPVRCREGVEQLAGHVRQASAALARVHHEQVERPSESSPWLAIRIPLAWSTTARSVSPTPTWRVTSRRSTSSWAAVLSITMPMISTIAPTRRDGPGQ